MWLMLQAIKQKKVSSPGAPLTSPLRDAAIPAIIYLHSQPYAQWSGKAAVNGDDPSVRPPQNPFKAVHSAHAATFLFGVK